MIPDNREGMNINDIEEAKQSALGSISKTRVQPMNESKESIESSSINDAP